MNERGEWFGCVFTAEEKRIYLQLRLFLVNYQCKRLGNIYIIVQKLIVLTIQLYGPFKLGNSNYFKKTTLTCEWRCMFHPLQKVHFLHHRPIFFVLLGTHRLHSYMACFITCTLQINRSFFNFSEWLFKICLQITKLFCALPARKGLGRCEKLWMFHEDCFYSSNL